MDNRKKKRDQIFALLDAVQSDDEEDFDQLMKLLIKVTNTKTLTPKANIYVTSNNKDVNNSDENGDADQ